MKARELTQVSLTHEHLLYTLNYNEVTGIFTWRRTVGPNAKLNEIAGCLNTTGYIRIRIRNYTYSAQRLAWFYVYKEWPQYNIDHIDRNKQNNAISNLRDVQQTINTHNSKVRSDNTSNVKGVYFNQRNKRWEVAITINKKRHYLGAFIDYEFAVKARKEAEKKYLKEMGR